MPHLRVPLCQFFVLAFNLSAFSLALFLGIYPAIVFSGIFSAALPLTFFGKNIFVALPSLAFIAWSSYLSIFSASPRISRYLIFGCWSIIFLWNLFFDPLVLGQSQSILDCLYLLNLPSAWLLAHSLSLTKSSQLKSLNLVIVISIVVAGLLHINYIFFPDLAIIDIGDGVASFNLESVTTRSMLLNPSMHGSIVVLGMLAVYASWRDEIYFYSSKFLALFLVVLMYSSLFYGQSRTPLFAGSVVLLVFLYQFFLQKSGWCFLLILGFVVSLVLNVVFQGGIIMVYLNNLISRGDLYESGDRDLKLFLSIELAFSSVKSFLFGLSNTVVASASLSGVAVSDNSFFHLALRFGVPVSALFYCINFAIARIYGFFSFSRVLLSCFVLVNLALTNSILWQPFILPAVVLFVALPSSRTLIGSSHLDVLQSARGSVLIAGVSKDQRVVA